MMKMQQVAIYPFVMGHEKCDMTNTKTKPIMMRLMMLKIGFMLNMRDRIDDKKKQTILY